MAYTSTLLRTTRLRLQRLRRLSGRVSMISTVSPTLAAFSSSCTMNFDVRRCVLPYSPWRTCHCTATTQLFCILSLTTTPVFSAFCDITSPALLSDHGLDPREIAAHRAHLFRHFQLPHRLLQAHPEERVGQLALLRAELVGAEVAQFCGLHSIFSCANRVANFVRIGTFAAASFIASRASFSLTPSISNRILPGRMTATHCSGAPFPLPMRVSCGFLVIGLSGNTRHHTLPPRATKRVIATRAASIWRSVSQHGSSAFSPYSPNSTSAPRHAFPAMRPRCCFRYLTFFGIIMMRHPHSRSTQNTPNSQNLSCSSPKNILRILRVPRLTSVYARACGRRGARSRYSSSRPRCGTRRSPLYSQTLMPICPYVVFASAKP